MTARSASMASPVSSSGGRSMRIIATCLLIAMAAVYGLARWGETTHAADLGPWIGYVRAFAEAAMVGGLADWFAVTALFRHPLGVPIPHTAIIPRNKDRIGDTLALFLRDNFLTPAVVARRMVRLDMAGAAGRFLAAPPDVDGRLRRGASRLLADVMDALDDERLGIMVKGAIAQRLRAVDFAPMIGQALDAAIREGRHEPVMQAIITWASRTLDANAVLIRQMVHDKAGAIVRWTGLDETLANAILSGLQKMLAEAAADPQHSLRIKAMEGIESLAHRLQHEPEMQGRIGRVRDEIIGNPAMQAWMESLWRQAREALLRSARDPRTALAGRFGDMLRQLGTMLEEDATVRLLLNRFARRVAVGTAASYGDAIVRLVSETVRGWDAQTITNRLEQAVGRDLQYIRINGTLVGGLVGVIIHAVGRQF
ncbi:DUF445 domain-containing protein [Sphingobium sufflavum]|uniref:DUF445 domain-containing protein n=1 Tax=Sphingobium sufflavum TaxID=1129547 RepID=UPI001F3C19DD|nr:DUF445 domain-containing protein [Sphingobium sufflavum]MCE7795836.1 DUF445 domain-containing protein [Sphingobium sufflavum]